MLYIPIMIPMPIVHGGGNVSGHQLGVILLCCFAYLLWVGFSIYIGEKISDLGKSFAVTMVMGLLLPLLIVGLLLI